MNLGRSSLDLHVFLCPCILASDAPARNAKDACLERLALVPTVRAQSAQEVGDAMSNQQEQRRFRAGHLRIFEGNQPAGFVLDTTPKSAKARWCAKEQVDSNGTMREQLCGDEASQQSALRTFCPNDSTGAVNPTCVQSV